VQGNPAAKLDQFNAVSQTASNYVQVCLHTGIIVSDAELIASQKGEGLVSLALLILVSEINRA
jgi:hypothetical protein